MPHGEFFLRRDPSATVPRQSGVWSLDCLAWCLPRAGRRVRCWSIDNLIQSVEKFGSSPPACALQRGRVEDWFSGWLGEMEGCGLGVGRMAEMDAKHKRLSDALSPSLFTLLASDHQPLLAPRCSGCVRAGMVCIMGHLAIDRGPKRQWRRRVLISPRNGLDSVRLSCSCSCLARGWGEESRRGACQMSVSVSIVNASSPSSHGREVRGGDGGLSSQNDARGNATCDRDCASLCSCRRKRPMIGFRRQFEMQAQAGGP
ncbi:hypothetical protein QBC39DRAFT_25540 [Podospora conica]|nr:hypothetical protein QBC39DRAFT_25540 [Schizothecium conicum]